MLSVVTIAQSPKPGSAILPFFSLPPAHILLFFCDVLVRLIRTMLADMYRLTTVLL